MEKYKLGFIGTGNMGKAIISGIADRKFTSPQNITASDINADQLRDLHLSLGINIEQDNAKVIEASDICFVCLKPDAIRDALELLKAAVTPKKIVVSIAAGVPIAFYENILGADKKIVRTMPNTPALVGAGMTLISCGKTVTAAEAVTVKSIFECLGKAEFIGEELMGEVVALSGSSPAYVFMMIDIMAKHAIKRGIPEKIAYTAAEQVVYGAAKMAMLTGVDPEILKQQVCSPGGTTIEAVKVLEKQDLAAIMDEAMDACTRKSDEISGRFK